MSTQAPLQFGPAELARLDQIRRKVTPAHYAAVDEQWAARTLSDYIKPLTYPIRPEGSPKRTSREAEALRNEYKTALEARAKFCELFTGDSPFFCVPIPIHQPSVLVTYSAHEAIVQGRARLAAWIPGNEAWLPMYHTLVQKPSDVFPARGHGQFNHRRFIELMLLPACASLVFSFIQSTALRMAWACRLKPSNSSPVVWLGYKEWPSLNFFDRARVVLAAHEYEEYIHDALEHRRLGLAPPSMPWHMAHTLNFNSLGHMPSPTSRQARRSQVSQSQLRLR